MTELERVVVLPPVPALLRAYRGRVDPVPELRDACRSAVSWLLEDCVDAVQVLADEPDEVARSRGVDVSLGLRVARHLLDEAGHPQPAGDPAGAANLDGKRLLVLANGSARRSLKAPGHLDPRSFDFDEGIEKALGAGDAASLAMIDSGLGHDLLAAGIEPLRRLGALRREVAQARLCYVGDPYGVRYWVATWLFDIKQTN